MKNKNQIKSDSLCSPGLCGEKIILNGALLEKDKAVICAATPGVMFGAGLFETFRFVSGSAVFIEDHLDRMKASAAELKIPEPPGVEIVCQSARELVEACGLDDARIRLTLLEKGDGKTDWFMTSAPLPAGKASFHCTVQLFALSEIRRHKTINYLENRRTLEKANENGFDEAIFYDSVDVILEGTMTNVFTVRDGELFTTSLNLPVLPGITRKRVLDLARKAGIPVWEDYFTIENLFASDEVFLTNSIRGIIPVSRIDNKKIGFKVMGELTSTLQNLYNRFMDEYIGKQEN